MATTERTSRQTDDEINQPEITQLQKDALYIHPSEHSSLVLSSSPLDGTNFLTWSRAIYVSLGTKMKLGFIDGTFPRPPIGSATFEQWRRVDLMVTSWIWNSISKEIVEAFMYVASSRELWLELQGRYGRSNGPMVYQIQREISLVSQRDLSLTAYVTKVKKLWNELACLAPTPKCTCGRCTCGINKAITDRNESSQLIQFLMGLHDSFDSERSQILMQDPLPDLERAFSMVFAVEKQRAVHVDMAESSSHMACQLAFKENRKEGADKIIHKKKPYVIRKICFVRIVVKQGMLRTHVFNSMECLSGFKSLSHKKRRGDTSRPFAANIDEKSVTTGTTTTPTMAELMTNLINLMQKGNLPSDPITNYANYAHYDEEFAGKVSNLTKIDLSCWIIDSGATNHICANITFFKSYSKPLHPQFIHLPDGSKKAVLYTGNVQLNDTITLDHVLFIPDFSVNLLSVSQLSKSRPYQFLFSQHDCVLQDLVTKASLLVGTLFKSFTYSSIVPLPVLLFL
ncbi:UNVERIFIED_CONTAM: hypothetical protein Sradi_3718000 [Sesamum radiatum]|uniref:Retrotransposon Copia-like N-terminal domain-containing protein n=1 Tax=Sesamum radiatum TaxID=300843 RepID=A0AAW2PXU1_SESRA